MREIKFKAWDVRYKIMYMVKSITFRKNNDVYRVYGDHHKDNYFHIINPDDTILIQYTGLKDKNGKEIYEGDIVKLFSTNREVLFKNGGYGYIANNDPNDFIHLGHNYHFNWINNQSLIIEIIGNIYENPELLKQENE